MAMAVGGRGGAKADINMTPLIDVLLVLLIIFMVIIAARSDGTDALVPQPRRQMRRHLHPARPHSVIIIDKDKKMMMNTEQPTSNGLAIG